MKTLQILAKLGTAAGALCLLLVATPAAAQTACGGDGQRGCCVASTERLSTGACQSGLTEVAGCTGNCACGGSGLAVFLGSSSSSTCQAPTSCGGPGERACCITEQQWAGNPLPFSAGCRFDTTYSGLNGLTEVAGGAGMGVLCGGSNPLGLRSNGTCQTCGTQGAHACLTSTNTFECQTGLVKDIFGFCAACGGEGQPLCDMGLCSPGFHPNGGLCQPDRVIAEPNCNCTPASPSGTASTPVKGYADLHLHMFGNLAFGGLTVWGDAFDKAGGISRALRADNFAQRTADRILNFRVIQGVESLTVLPPDPLRQQTLVHGDGHFNDIIGAGTDQHFPGLLPNGGVEWDPNVANAASLDFAGWPHWDSTTHQQVYYRWLERAYVGGLRLAVLLGVNNEAMCASQKRFIDPDFADCSDTMPSVKLQFAKARELEQWLGEQCAAGVATACARNQPATQRAGWFKVVTTPAMARAAIANGQLAVVLGIEEASLFGCKSGVCTPESVRQAIDDYHAIGVRHIFPIHNFDNGFGGAATWMDTISIGNAYSTTEYYDAENCPATPAFNNDNGYGFKLYSETASDFLVQFTQSLSRLAFGLDIFGWPTYTDLTTTCNRKGLTSLGDFMVREMMARKLIIDVDHMSIRALDQALTIAEAASYPGIVASHVLMFELAEKADRHERMRTRAQLKRIAELGGMIAAMTQPPVGGVIGPPNSKVVGECTGSSTSWAHAYEYAVDVMTVTRVVDGEPRAIKPAIAFGTDFNGISAHNSPRFGEDGCVSSDDSTRLAYPFTLGGFGTFGQQVTSNRSFDFNTQGLAHVGLLPDMVADLKQVGLTDEDLEPLFSSAEAYIRMWEKAEETDLPTIDFSGDTVAPVTTATQAPAANVNNWNNTPVTVSLQATDATLPSSGVAEILHSIGVGGLSTVTGGSSVLIPVTQNGATSISYAARDLAGNQEPTRTYTVSIDTVNPLINGTRAPLANAAGWNNTPVVGTFGCSDERSGIDTCTGEVVVSTDGANQEAVGSARDKAGNTAAYAIGGINIDRTVPTITGVRLPLANAVGWNNTNIDVTFTCNDALSGVATCTQPDVVTTEGVNQSRSGTATDKAGNAASATVAAINIDRTPPTISGARAPLANGYGWNNTTVQVTFTCVDTLSNIASCGPGQSISAEGANQVSSGTAIDNAGNSTTAVVGSISIDVTPPAVSVTGVTHGATYMLGQVPATACDTADSLSGVLTSATASVTGGTGAGVGQFTALCSGAVDRAGNTGSASATYAVHYPFTGFFPPVDNLPVFNRATAGSTIPLKFNLAGNFGLGILMPGSPVSNAINCESSATIADVEETATATTSGLTFDPLTAQYQYNWKTERAWRGSCRLLTVALNDGSLHQMKVWFR